MDRLPDNQIAHDLALIYAKNDLNERINEKALCNEKMDNEEKATALYDSYLYAFYQINESLKSVLEADYNGGY